MKKIKFLFLFFILLLNLSFTINFKFLINNIKYYEKSNETILNYERKVYFSIQSFQNDNAFERYLDFLKNNRISGITFYGVHKKLKVSPSEIFAKLKEQIPKIEIYIAGDNFDFFKNINDDKNLIQYIDGFHIEYEYWNYFKYKKKKIEMMLSIILYKNQKRSKFFQMKTIKNLKHILDGLQKKKQKYFYLFMTLF